MNYEVLKNIKILGIKSRTLCIYHFAKISNFKTHITMNNIFKGLIAGYGASKLGGGCFGTVIVFIIIWVVLERCT